MIDRPVNVKDVTPYYHVRLQLVGGGQEFWRNLTRDDAIREIVIPYVHGQVVFGKAGALLNFKVVRDLIFYRTQGKIAPTVEPGNLIGTNCTSEFINEIRAFMGGPRIASLLEKAMAPVLDQVFVVMKYGSKQLDSAYDRVIRPVAAEFGLHTLRIDQVQNSGKINDQILDEIARSRFVLADLTGERPNCYYETGFAHALGKEIILTVRREHAIHFDLAGYRFIVWESEAELDAALRARWESLLNPSNVTHIYQTHEDEEKERLLRANLRSIPPSNGL